MQIGVHTGELRAGAARVSEVTIALAFVRAELGRAGASTRWARGPIEGALHRLLGTLDWALDQASRAADDRGRCLVKGAESYEQADQLVAP